MAVSGSGMMAMLANELHLMKALFPMVGATDLGMVTPSNDNDDALHSSKACAPVVVAEPGMVTVCTAFLPPSHFSFQQGRGIIVAVPSVLTLTADIARAATCTLWLQMHPLQTDPGVPLSESLLLAFAPWFKAEQKGKAKERRKRKRKV